MNTGIRSSAISVPAQSETLSFIPDDSRQGDYCINVVIPVFNEEQCLQSCFNRLQSLFDGLKCRYKLIFVNDGSSDRSINILEEFKKRRPDNVCVVDLSRNFGHQVAVTAGIDHADGDAIVIIDADLQDPPEVIPQLIDKWKEGFDVVNARRSVRLGESAFKKWTAALHYKLLASISEVALPRDVGDFRLISKRVAIDLGNIRERTRYVRGLVSWVGYKQTCVDYVRHERAAGKTKYNLAKMLLLSVNGIAAFSLLPLRIASWCGFLSAVGAGITLVLAIAAKCFMHSVITGWTSVMVAVLFIGGLQLICLGIMGEYIGMLCTEAKGRPLYLVNRIF